MYHLLLVVSFIAAASAQTCSVALEPSVSNMCPAGYTIIENQCCPNGKVVACADKVNPQTGVSDCPKMASYCTNSAYRELMADQCKKTCNLCSGTGTTCQDKINPQTGVSDCPRMASYCNNSDYRNLMAVECRKTCGLC